MSGPAFIPVPLAGGLADSPGSLCTGRLYGLGGDYFPQQSCRPDANDHVYEELGDKRWSIIIGSQWRRCLKSGQSWQSINQADTVPCALCQSIDHVNISGEML